MDEKFESVKKIFETCNEEELQSLTKFMLDFLNMTAEEKTKAPTIQSERPSNCKFCNSTRIIRHGKIANGSPRYICKDCKKTFTVPNYTGIRYGKLSEKQWRDLLKGIVLNLSIPKLSAMTGISKNTCWTNKIKLCMAIQEKYGYQVKGFKGTVEADEYYLPTSFKGKRDAKFFIYELKRMPRHHRTLAERIKYLEQDNIYEQLELNDPAYLNELLYGDVNAKKPGISDDQVCFLTFVDSSNDVYVQPVCVGRMSISDMESLRGKFEQANTLVTDSHNAYPSLAASENLLHMQIQSGEHTVGKFNLGKVNGLHSNLNRYWPHKLGRAPSLKYMDVEIMLFWWLNQNEQLTVDEKVDGLYKILLEVYGKTTVDYNSISKHKTRINVERLCSKEQV